MLRYQLELANYLVLSDLPDEKRSNQLSSVVSLRKRQIRIFDLVRSIFANRNTKFSREKVKPRIIRETKFIRECGCIFTSEENEEIALQEDKAKIRES